jgi:hypothetical protein
MSATRSLVEEYALEIVSRCRAIKNRCNQLLTLDFVSQSPLALARTISNVSEYLEDVVLEILHNVDWTDPDSVEDDQQNLRTVDAVIHRLAAELRYIEGATTIRLPWSVISAFERLVRTLLPRTDVMLRPQWHYNYGSHVLDFRRVYLEELEGFKLLVDRDIRRVLAPIPNHFHILTFPVLERKNILLHSLLGHEIGHLIVSDVAPANRRRFLRSIRNSVGQQTGRLIPAASGDSEAIALTKSFLTVQYLETAELCWERAVTELLADVVGATLFGPAALFSALEMAIQQGFDAPPARETEYYPPWRLRLRLIWETLQPIRAGFFPVQPQAFPGPGAKKRADRINQRYDLVKEIIEQTTDIDAVQEQPVVAIAYRQVMPLVQSKRRHLLSGPLVRHRVKASQLYTTTRPLIERLDHGVPPNVILEDSTRSQPANLVQIINAAWFHKVSWEHTDFLTDDKTSEAWRTTRNRLNNLTLKAIEFSDLALSFDESIHASKNKTSGSNRRRPKQD